MNKIILAASVIIVILVVGFFSWYRARHLQPGGPTSKPPSQQREDSESKSFQSQSLQFSLVVPMEFRIDERLTYVDLKRGNSKIGISKNSTNFDNVRSYVESFDAIRSGINILGQRDVKIGVLDAITRVEEFSVGPVAQQKVYFIHVDNKVYTLSTPNEDLYDDLDQIAQSFRYTP